MVTFMCFHCDRTLLKPQVSKHIKQQCRQPPKLICIDCKKVFNDDHIGHTQCLSEKQLYWGQYANGKKPNQQEKQQNQTIQHQKQEDQSTQEEKQNWKGWRKSIDQYMKSQKKEVKLDDAKQSVIQQFLDINPSYNEKDAEELFNQAIQSSKKYNVEYVGYIVKKVKQE